MHFSYVEMSPNCSILPSIFQNFPVGGHAPRPPWSPGAHLLAPKRLVPWVTPPPPPPPLL